jgi:prepilin-type N-terminal cleavage/methylation domain-containing protein
VRRGFTLIELIIVIALIALVGGLVVVNAQAILRGLGEEPAERVFQKAVREARYQAASLKESVFLKFDGDEAAISVVSENGAVLATFRLADDSGRQQPSIEFEQVLPGMGLDPGRGDTTPVDALVFRPDRSSTPFAVTFDLGPAVFTQRYDPFSAIVIDDSRNR